MPEAEETVAAKTVFTLPAVSDEDVDKLEARFKAIHEELTQTIYALGKNQEFWDDEWQYKKGEGGGRTRVWGKGEPFNPGDETKAEPVFWEKVGCNWSGIKGTNLPASALLKWDVDVTKETTFRATGVSMVCHPSNPWVPTCHANIRFFQAGGVWWFGGGIDVTPYYPFPEQAVAFHMILKQVCEKHGADYRAFKETCDNYFYLSHRGETRGIGGIFFDNLHLEGDWDKTMNFVEDVGHAVSKTLMYFAGNAKRPFSQEMRSFQLYRRSRYVEFNLLFDRGTKFGIMSRGRTESILVSMPGLAEWVYSWSPKEGSMEEYLYKHFLQAQPWAEMDVSGIPLELQQPEAYSHYPCHPYLIFTKATSPLAKPVFQPGYGVVVAAAVTGTVLGFATARLLSLKME